MIRLKGTISAMLGPTNTGKTHYALERMASYRTGMIGFPLRLLARENYDRLVKIKGLHSVALITGEEKIIPPNPTHYICTVESMPSTIRVDFLCVDEIQLCGDSERGHIFTDRLLRSRGEQETLFLGSLTIKNLLQKLIPECHIETRDRFSTLTYNGYRKITRLPRRSAIVAFNINEVYRIAEFIRLHRGGTAIVLGALSPRTRNAQVDMYQKGEVDYLVATDAIGMGLNMDIDHVALAATRKYDGQHARTLRADELAQIAGRAGRYRTPGSFGVTSKLDALDEDIAEAIESHQFEPLTQLRWRNPHLEFKTIDALLKSLNEPAPDPCFIPVRMADDQLALQALCNKPEIKRVCQSMDIIRLLWDVCAIPDFRKSTSDEHHKLLEQIFHFLVSDNHVLPDSWCAENIQRLDRCDGDLDTLLNRIAHVRTWTYITHVKNWVIGAEQWQNITKNIEDRLSDALHERLTHRFVDKRTSQLLRGLANRDKLLAGVRQDGTVIVEGHIIGKLQGWRFMAEKTLLDADQDAVMRTARAALKEPLMDAIGVFAQQVDNAFHMDDLLQITWRHGESVFPIAKLTKGQNFYTPKIILLHTELLDDAQNLIIQARLDLWLSELIAKTMGNLLALENAEILKGTARGIAFQIYEHGGIVERDTVKELIKTLEKEDRQALNKLGVRIGAFHVYQRDVLKPANMRTKSLLWRLSQDMTTISFPLPQDGNVSMTVPEQATENNAVEFYKAIGLPIMGKMCVRIDMLDRLNSAIFDGAVEGKYRFDPALASTIGVSVEIIQDLLLQLGFPFEELKEGEGEEAKIVRLYSLKKIKPIKEKPKFTAKKPVPTTDFKKTIEKKRKANVPIKTLVAAPKTTSGYNAFASLSALKESKKSD